MTQDAYDRLLAAMPDIASVVNGFNSEAVQQSAFALLVSAMGANGEIFLPPKDEPEAQIPDEKEGELGGVKTGAGQSAKGSSTAKRSRKTPAKRGPSSLVKDLDLRPSGKQSFKEFADEKKPSKIYERNLVAIYYLQHVLELENIGASHVLAAYRECSWREPGNLTQSIRDAAARKGWLDSSDGNNLTTTASGRNLVTHDMPLTQGSKK